MDGGSWGATERTHAPPVRVLYTGKWTFLRTAASNDDGMVRCQGGSNDNDREGRPWVHCV